MIVRPALGFWPLALPLFLSLQLMTSRIRLLRLTPEVSVAKLEALGSEAVFACDCYVSGIENGIEVPGGYQLGRVTNVDHHAPTARMQQVISSANLALEHVSRFGALDSGTPVAITHTDCDSILSSGIVSGRLEPRPEFGDAAIAADHTGEANSIADLLQGLDGKRNLELSFRNLSLLLSGRVLEREANVALDQRRRKRADAARAIEDGRVKLDGPLGWGVLDSALDGEFFPSLLPDAVIILLAARSPHDPSRWHMKVRLGSGAPQGMSLQGLGIKKFDPAYGGRWNAGSNKRGGGTTLEPAQYAEQLRERAG